jgi:hypothetical protein
VGVGRPPEGYRGDEASWVLSPFSEPQAEVDALIERATQMVEVALDQGIEAAIARFHAAEPGARARRRAERRAAGEDAGPIGSPAPAGGPADPGEVAGDD